MRYSKQHKQRTRAKIIETAGRVFRERGYHAAGVDGLMAETGLTSGAFYGHFDSKEDLLTEVVRSAVRANEEARERGLEHLEGAEWVRAMLTRYMSEAHWSSVREGCPMPTLISELPRCSLETRRAFAEGFETLVDRLTSQLRGDPDARQRTLASLALAVGAMALARAIGDDDLSKEILRAGRTFGTNHLVPPDDNNEESQ